MFILNKFIALFFSPIKFYVAVTPDLGHGTAITFSTGFLARVLDVSWSGIERASIETTTMDDSAGGKTFMPGDMYDPGELSVEMQFDSDATPPVNSAPETVTVTWPDAETMAAQGFMTGYEIGNVSSEGVMTATATIKFTGDITF